MKGFVVVVIVIVIIGAIFGSCGENQYDKDYYSSRNKTWDEMTPGEKNVVKDEIEWTIKQSEENGGDWSN